jgi:hypothetical protein
MREEYGALTGRAAAAVGVSVALHLAAFALSGSVLIGALVTADIGGADLLVVDMLTADAPSWARSPGQSARGAAPPAGGSTRGRAPLAGDTASARRSPSRPVAAAEPPLAGPIAAVDPDTPALAAESPVNPDAPALAAESPVNPDAPALAAELPIDPGAWALVAESTLDAPIRAPVAEPAGGGAPAVAAVGDVPGADAAGLEREAAAAGDQADPARAAAGDADREAGGIDGDGEPARTAEAAVAAALRVNLRRLGEVTRNPSVSARAEGQPFVGRREVFEFLLDHPDFATHVTRALRLARYRMWRAGDELFVDDGWGATGRVFVVYAASGTRVLYARGEFQSGLLPAIPGEAVVTITYDAQPAGDGRELLSANISSQLKIGGALGDLVVRVASSLATEKAERESRRLVRTFARVLQAVDEKPAALYATLLERPDVPQRELEQFRVLLKLP